jgi:hypothetical protein
MDPEPFPDNGFGLRWRLPERAEMPPLARRMDPSRLRVLRFGPPPKCTPATQSGLELHIRTVTVSAYASSSPDDGSKTLNGPEPPLRFRSPPALPESPEVPRLPRRMDPSRTRKVTLSASASTSPRVPKCHAYHAEWTRAVYKDRYHFALPRCLPKIAEIPCLPRSMDPSRVRTVTVSACTSASLQRLPRRMDPSRIHTDMVPASASASLRVPHVFPRSAA